jgi:hypothetical protein
MKNLMKKAIEELTGEEVSFLENGISWFEFDEFASKITVEDDKVIFVSELEDGSKSTVRVNKEVFEKDIEKGTFRLYDLNLMYTEGDRDNLLYDEEGFVRENLILDIDDKEFIFDN